jgi:hypothetical protein
MHEEREFVETHLAALVDGAPLEPELRQRLERLIAENPLYRRWYEQQRVVRQLLRERAAALRYPVPARLSVRVWRKLLWRQFGGIRRWAPVLAPVAVAAALVVGYLLVQSPSSRSAPMCFATALQTAFRQLQQGQLLITPVTDTAAVQQYFRRHGVSYTVLLPYMEHTVQLVGATVWSEENYRLPMVVYRAGADWILLSEAPQEEFDARRLWLDSLHWNAVQQRQWSWQRCDTALLCTFWGADAMVCGIATTVPAQQLQQLMEVESESHSDGQAE